MAVADRLSQVAAAICRGAHPTRWDYRATSSPCSQCVAGAESVIAAGLLPETVSEWGLRDDWGHVEIAYLQGPYTEETARNRLCQRIDDPELVHREVTSWVPADEGSDRG